MDIHRSEAFDPALPMKYITLSKSLVISGRVCISTDLTQVVHIVRPSSLYVT